MATEATQTSNLKLSDLIPDAANANKGTERGNAVIAASVRDLGAGRSILLDRYNRIIAGNKTTEGAAAVNLDQNVIVVESDGTQLVAVRRTDLSIDEPRGRALAHADNRASELNLDYDFEILAPQLLDLQQAGIDLEAHGWAHYELDPILGATWSPAGIDESESANVAPPPGSVHILVNQEQLKALQPAIADVRARANNDKLTQGHCLMVICRDWAAAKSAAVNEEADVSR